ncbi:Dynein heavy chain [Spironucleus salmonicida]|uniref:Dynein heavy chain n=1 Tax=Spironucleus salmonicida TaxID=348837 RepID=V6LX80_9EUKA|nr:Dynein heavy chain [Spironucleus salmonicida]|eukprot:EST45429.1 Dynein heavy chain [Spironucleus salmonicida]
MEQLYMFISKSVATISGQELPEQQPQDTTVALQRFVTPIEPQNHVLLVYFESDKLFIENSLSRTGVDHVFYLLRKNTFDIENLMQTTQAGLVSGQVVDQLLLVMNQVYGPWIKLSNDWPKTVKEEFVNHLERYLSSVTEAAFLLKKRTVLYVPYFDQDPQEQSRNKDLIPRLESLVVHWTRQIKELISGVHSGTNAEESNATSTLHNNYYTFPLLLNPLTEIEYWRRRNSDLQSVISQLQTKSLQNIVQTLKLANSHYAGQFQELQNQIQQKTIEANNNLTNLQLIEESCVKLNSSNLPSEITEILPTLLEQVVIISQNSVYYAKESNLSSLLRRVANAVVNASADYIQVSDVFENDALNSVHRLLECRQLTNQFNNLYAELCSRDASSWKYDSSVVASCEAFGQRCVDLLEVCQDRLQFVRPQALLTSNVGIIKRIKVEMNQENQQKNNALVKILANIGKVIGEAEEKSQSNIQEYESGDYLLPKFSGSQGQIIRKSIKEMMRTYNKSLKTLQTVKYNHLDVKSSQWHEDIAAYRSGVKDLTVFAENIMRTSFSQAQHSVIDSCSVLEAFNHLASRPAFKNSVNKRILDTVRLFIDRVNQLKSQFETLRSSTAQNTQQGAQTTTIQLNAILSHQIYMPSKGSYALSIKRFLSQLESDWDAITASFWLPAGTKQAALDYLANEVKTGVTKSKDTTQSRDTQDAIEAYARARYLFENQVTLTYQQWVKSLTTDLPEVDGKKRTLDSLLEDSIIQLVPTNKFGIDNKSTDLNLTLLLNVLKVHFPPEIDQAIKEFAFWKQMSYTVNDTVQDLFNKRNVLHQRKQLVSQCVMEINNVIENLKFEEINLFKSRLSNLANSIQPAYTTFGWNTRGILQHISSYRRQAVETYELTCIFHEKSKLIDDSIKQLSQINLVQLKNSQKQFTPSEFKNLQIQQIKTSVEKIHCTLENTLNALCACYEIFRSDGEDVQREWINYISEVDKRVEQALIQMLIQSFEDFAFQSTGRRSKPSDQQQFNTYKPDVQSLFKLSLELNKETQKPALKPNSSDLYSSVREVLQNIVVKVITDIQRLPQSLKIKEIALRKIKRQEALEKATSRIEQRKREGLPTTDNDLAEIMQEVTGWDCLPDPNYSVKEDYINIFDFLTPYFTEDKSKMLFQRLKSGTNPKEQLESVVGWILVYFAQSGIEAERWLNNYVKYQDLWQEDVQKYHLKHNLLNKPLQEFDESIKYFDNLASQVQNEDNYVSVKAIFLDANSFKLDLIKKAHEFHNTLVKVLQDNTLADLDMIVNDLQDICDSVSKASQSIDDLQNQIKKLEEAKKYLEAIDEKVQPMGKKLELLAQLEAEIPAEKVQSANKLMDQIEAAKRSIEEGIQQISRDKNKFRDQTQQDSAKLSSDSSELRKELMADGPFRHNVVQKDHTLPVGENDIIQATRLLNKFKNKYDDLLSQKDTVDHGLSVFGNEFRDMKDINAINVTITQLRQVWDIQQEWFNFYEKQKQLQLNDVESQVLEDQHKKLNFSTRKFNNEMKQWEVCDYMVKKASEFRPIPAIVLDLTNKALRGRHWAQITAVTSVELELPMIEDIPQGTIPLDPNSNLFTLEFIVNSKLKEYPEEINQISGGATQELKIEQGINEIINDWKYIEFFVAPYASKMIGGSSGAAQHQHYIIKQTDDIFTKLEEHTSLLSSMKGQKFAKAFEYQLDCWENMLGQIQESIELIIQTQRSWMYLESIFAASEDIRKQLPAESLMFDEANELWKRSMTRINKQKQVLLCLDSVEVNSSKIQLKKQSQIIKHMLEIIETLDQVQKRLEDYLELKRSQFPRFYFLSNDELLEILAQSRDPRAVQPHIKKCFDGIKKLDMSEGKSPVIASGLFGLCGEYVPFIKSVNCSNSVEVWLNAIEETMRSTLREMAPKCFSDLMQDKLPLQFFLGKWPGQLTTSAGQMKWTLTVQTALQSGQKYLNQEQNEDDEPIENGERPGMKECLETVRRNLKNARKLSILFLNKLTEIVRSTPTEISEKVPSQIPAIFKPNYMHNLVTNKTRAHITLEVHNRDIIEELYHAKIWNDKCFEWLSQLKFYLITDKKKDDKAEEPYILCRQTSTELKYQYEYINNSGRLVVTPLTDRCYITITSSMEIQKGTLPQGPAGTGKTETVKDLTKGLGILCVVFNCSDGLDFKSLGRLLSGLCQSGAWSCFDEFNRLLPDVLSVVAQQINSILQAVSRDVSKFMFEGREIPLNNNINVCITMNPGYAGRSELPENLQQLFRPISMVVPDMRLISEVMIYSEGFTTARILGQKLTSLFALCNLQLSKQSHYDWTLRSLKAILVAAGSLRRSYPLYSEDVVLMRAMQFSTEPKLIKADQPLFRGLVSDLFPGLELSEVSYGLLDAAIDMEFHIRNLFFNSRQKEKVLQLYEAKSGRHGVMLIGKSGGSKTLVYEILAAAEIRCYRAYVESCDSKSAFKNPYSLLIKHAIEANNLKNIDIFLKVVYNDHLGNDKVLSERNFFIKTLYWFRDNSKIEDHGNNKKVTLVTANNNPEPIYDQTKATMHDVQYPTTISYINPKSLDLNQLYGAMDLSTMEWVDGVVSNILRSTSQESQNGQAFGAYTVEQLQQIAKDTKDFRYDFIQNLVRFKCYWVMYDGPVDTLWIESQNSVLDDSKVLTLVNGERIAFPSQISMLFEANDLDVASPATVSRCGQCYFDLNDVNWEWQYWQWVEAKYKNSGSVQNLTNEAKQIVVEVLESFAAKVLRKLFLLKTNDELPQIIPQADYAIVRMFIHLFEAFCADYNGLEIIQGEEAQVNRVLEMIIIFSVVWAFGGSLTPQGRKNFDIAVRELDGSLPATDSVFEYRVDFGKKQWIHWNDSVPKNWRPAPGIPIYAAIVPTVDTVRTEYIMKTLLLQENLYYLQKKHYITLAGTNEYTTNFGTLLFGTSGTGKTGIIKNIIIPAFDQANILNSAYEIFNNKALASDSASDIEKFYVKGLLGKYDAVQLGLSAQTSADRIRAVIESRLGQRGNSLAAKGTRLMAFLDDFNMPSYDDYGSQPSLETVKLYAERGSWYKQKKTQYNLTNIYDVDILASMATPGGGRNQVSGRILSKFNIVSIDTPADSVLKSIFQTLLSLHFQSFDETIRQQIEYLVQAGIEVFNTISSTLLPTPVKPFYVFNLRDLSKFFLGLMNADSEQQSSPDTIVKLWVHECQRVYQDRLLPVDRQWFLELLGQKLGQHFNTTLSKVYTNKEPPIFVDFMETTPVPIPYGKEGDEKLVGIFQEANNRISLRKVVEEKLQYYNETHPPMDLVCFADAVEHICRMTRVLSQPSGHMLLVGTGGSGRTSLARLAASIQNQDIFTIDVGKNYRIQEFKEDMKKLFFTAGGSQNQPVCFLLNDNQIQYEAYLEDVNSILSSGEIPGLFNAEDMQSIRDMMSPIAKVMGLSENMDSCYNLLLRRAKENLHIVLAFSPSHEMFRTRLRMYPGLISSCTIDLFGEWPISALEEVSSYFMHQFVEFKEYDIYDNDEFSKKQPQTTGQPTSARKKHEPLSSRIAHCFSHLHDSAHQIYQQMMEATGRKLFVTPANYLSLVRLYRTVLLTQKGKIMYSLTKLQGGVGTLLDTRDFVETMRIELNEKKVEVDKAAADCELFIKEIAIKQEIADQKAQQISKDAEVLAVKQKQCEATVEFTKEKLQKAEPTLKAAQDALDALNDSDIVEVKSFKKFANSVQLVLFAVMVLLKKKPDLETAKAALNSSQVNFLQSLRRFDENSITEAQSKQLRKYLQDPNFTPETVAKASRACSSICQWVVALSEYATVYRQVKPLQDEYERSMAELAQQQELLRLAQEELAKITKQVEQLREDFRKSAAKKDELKRSAEELETKLQRADKLVNGLASERERWTQKIGELKNDLSKLPGDCLIASAFISYSGSLIGKYRRELMKKWMDGVIKYEVPYSGSTFNVAHFLAGAANIFQWTTFGLPSDNFSAENGVLITQTTKAPFIIDPQRQASRWLKRMYQNDPTQADNVKITNIKDPDHMKIIEMAVQFGQIVILEDVVENVDPSLDPIIQRQVVKKQGRNVIKIRDKDVEFNDNFRIFLCSRLNNPELTPELFAKCCIINFSVVKEGLTDQLLACVVSKERPELEEQKNKIVVNTAAMKDTIVKLEDQILQLLSSQAEAGGSILDNEPLIKALEDSKQTSIQITKELESSAITERKIDIARRGYQPISERASLLFFVLQDLSTIDFMYQFSLDAYTKLFINSIANSQQHDDISARIKILNEFHTYSVYKFCCRGLFTRHKVLLSLHMSAKILENQGKLNIQEYQFLLRGGQIFDKSQQPQNPSPDWISEQMWDNLCVLDKLGNFKNIVPQFEQRLKDWYQNYFIVTEPEHAPLIGEFEGNLDELQRMLVLRCIRPDRLIHAINNYIGNNIGINYTLPPPFDLGSALGDSAPTIPLIFILSPGTDPTATLINFSKQGRGDRADRLKIVALGQGQQEIARQAFYDGVKNGYWVLLANVHLSSSFLEELEKMIDDLSRQNVHKDFRLWLSTVASKTFPIGILQNSIKITTEAPAGIRANLANAYNVIENSVINTFAASNEDDAKRLSNPKNPQSLTIDQKDIAFRKVLFGTAFFYAQLVERRKFGTLGFNIKYPFSQADFETSITFVRKYIENYDVVPYEAIRYIVAQIVFGGRLIDELDRRVLICYIDELYNETVCGEEQYQFCPQYEQYYIPARGQLQDYKDYINQLPGTDPAALFGQHNNADVFSRRVESALFLSDLLSIQGQVEEPQQKQDEKDKQQENEEGEQKKEEKQSSTLSAREERIIQMAKDIMANLPAEITNLPPTIDPADPNAPMLSVLCQESARFSLLREKISNDMQDVQKGIRGLIGMSQHLDDIANDLSQNRLPVSWNLVYKSTKSLAPWSRDFTKRVEQLQKWANSGHPKCMWLGGLSVPTGYLTSLLQQASRKTGIAIDNLEWGFNITTALDPVRDIQDSQVPKIGDGVFVYDLFLEGAGWNIDNKCLKDSNPMELFVPMPVIKFIPQEQRKKSVKFKAAFYECPVYFYPIRTGTREQPSFMLNAWLAVGQNPSEMYVKRGTALLLNLGD